MKRGKNRLYKLYKSLPKEKREIIEFVSAILGIIAFVIDIAVAIYKIITYINNSGDDVNILFWTLFIIYLIISLILIIFFVTKVRQYKDNMWKRKTNVIESYENTLKEFNNLYFELLKYKKENSLTVEFLTHLVTDFLQTVVDDIVKIYEVYTGKSINACIKIIGTSNNDYDYANDLINENDAMLYTFVRSKNTSSVRKQNSLKDPVKLNQNTDFKKIVVEGRPSFYVENLEQYANNDNELSEKYENTTENYLNYYKGVIVVPIMMKHEFLHFTSVNEKNKCHILGFLCVDTLSDNAFIEESKNQFINIASSFANLSYIALNKYKYYYSKLEKAKLEETTNENK